jgi:predicted outer membrane repeat protein
MMILKIYKRKIKVMKTRIFTMLLVLGLSLGISVRAQIPIMGDLTLLFGASMPAAVYSVPGGANIFVPAGAVFTIESGTVIEFQNASFLQTFAGSRLTILNGCEFPMMTDSRFLIGGDFIVEGTSAARVFFHEHPSCGALSWDGIIFNACVADTVIINHAVIAETEKTTGALIFTERSGSICVSNSAFDVFQVNMTEFKKNTVAYFGGGIAIENSTCTNYFTINNCRFNENTAYMKGGAIYTRNTSAIITHSELYKNTATETGGGIHAINPQKYVIEFSNFKENSSTYEGGGAKFEYGLTANPILDIHDNSFYKNTTTRGGGLFLKNSGGNNLAMNTINNSFEKNDVIERGGGIFILDLINSFYSIDFNKFLENRAGREGGALYVKSDLTADFHIFKNSLEKNKARFGGGFYFNNALWGQVQMYENKFLKNQANIEGGACYITGDASTLEIVKNRFDQNSALLRDGGAIMFYGFDHVNPIIILQNSFGFNSARDGGAVCSKNEIGSQKKYINNLFYHNNATNNGGAVYCGSGYNFLNNTIVENGATVLAGGIFVTTGVVGLDGIINNILWGNIPNQVSNLLSMGGAYPAFVYCDINDAALANPMDFNADPQFVNPAMFDYHLQSISPCIESGDPAFVPTAYCGFWTEDLDWTARIKSVRIDVGAFEYEDPAKSTLAVNEVTENQSMTLYPSPAVSHVNVRINLTHASQVQVDLLDISGRTVKSFSPRWLAEGTNEFSLDVNDVSHGLYLVRISGKETTNVEKIMIR